MPTRLCEYLRADDLVVGVEVEGQRDVLQRERRQGLLRLGLGLQIRVVLAGGLEEELEELVRAADRRGDDVVEPLDGGEVHLRRRGPAAAGRGAARRRARPPEPRHDRADHGRRARLSGRHAVAPADQAAVLARVEPLGPLRPEPDHHLALHVAPGVVVVIDERSGHAVAEELHVRHRDGALAADVGRKLDALALEERPARSVRLDRDARAVGALDAEDRHLLEVGAVVARRPDAPLAQMVGDVEAGHGQPLGQRRPALEAVRRDVGQPLVHVRPGDGLASAAPTLRERRGRHQRARHGPQHPRRRTAIALHVR